MRSPAASDPLIDGAGQVAPGDVGLENRESTLNGHGLTGLFNGFCREKRRAYSRHPDREQGGGATRPVRGLACESIPAYLLRPIRPDSRM